MRKLLVMRGPQGSGKSTTLRTLGLDQNVVAPDRTRQFLNSPYLNRSGDFIIPQHRGGEVWRVTMDIIEQRMHAMETIAFDATLPVLKDLRPILELADKNRYQTTILDYYNIPQERAIAQNDTRTSIDYVPEYRIEQTYADYQPLENDVRVIPWSKDDSHIKTVQDILRVPTRDLNNYSEVVIIGDLQGCKTPLLDPQSPLRNGLKNDVYYIFVGDFFDRGLENAEVATWLLKNAVGKPNVAFERGNHELHIERWVDGLEPVSREFQEKTLPQLESAGFKANDFKELVDSLVEVIDARWNKYDILVTHGGLSGWPKDLHLVPGEQLESGVGTYEQPVDDLFEKWATAEELRRANGRHIIQAHGHRNTQMLPTLTTEHSFNLEGQVEFGGHQRMIRITSEGVIPVDIRNTLYKSYAEIVQETLGRGHKMHGPQLPVPAWHKRGEEGKNYLLQKTLAAIRKSELINQRVSAVLPHVSAYNFNREAFEGDVWTEEITTSRGLFTDENGYIVARGYPKFFNIGEKPETQIDVLAKTLKFPVTGYNKENGFLGITGYDPKTDTVIVASKSMLDSEFALWFREILESQLGPAGMERLYRVNRNLDLSCVFEVIDPVRDPHMIDYQKPEIILLGGIRRSEKFEELPYKDLQKITAYLGCRVKEQSFVLDNPIALQRMVQRVEKRDFMFKGAHTEGFVLEDANGQMIKQKSGYYAFWKRMRTAKEFIVRARNSDKPYSTERYKNDPEALAFVEFAIKQPTEALIQDIITLRAAYIKDPHAILPGSLTVEDLAQRKIEEDRAQAFEGYRRGVAIVDKQILNGTAKQETVLRIIEGANHDTQRMTLLEEFPGFKRALEAVLTTGIKHGR